MRASRGHSGTLHSAPTGLSHEFLLTPVVGMGVMTNSIMFLGRVNVFHVASQSREVGHVHLSAAWHARRRSMGCWLARRGCGRWKGEHCDGDLGRSGCASVKTWVISHVYGAYGR